jgi:hypothetical protein
VGYTNASNIQQENSEMEISHIFMNKLHL